MRAFSLRLPDGLVERVDLARGDVPRTVWIRRVIERELDGAEVAQALGSGPTGRFERRHAPTCKCPVCS